MYNNIKQIDDEIREFLKNEDNYDLAKKTAMNIIIKASAENKINFANDLESTIGIVCTLHLIHNLSFKQIENEAYALIRGNIETIDVNDEPYRN